MTVLRVRARFALSKAALAVMTLSAAGLFSGALAQQPAVPPASVAPSAPKPSKPARLEPAKPPAAEPAAAAAQSAPAAPAPQVATPGSAPGAPQFIYSPWAKFCGKGQDKGKDEAAKQVCFTGKDARTEAGQPAIAAALIEPDGEPKKLFRITLPNPLQLQYGTRVIVDQQPPMTGPFFTCFPDGCMADYEATPDLIGKLKHGQMVTIQAITLAGATISVPLPLVDFAKANEGPPTNPKVLEEQQQPQQEKKLHDELQRRADEALKKVESQRLLDELQKRADEARKKVESQRLRDELQQRADEARKKLESQTLRDELQKRADEARKKLESQGGAAPAPSR